MQNNSEDTIFEDEARRIARELWPSAQYDGAVIIDGQERDGVFESEECFHLLEATTSRRKDKAQKDIGKMIALASKLQRQKQWKAVKCWFVTKEEPTAEQRTVAVAHKGLVNAISYSQFQSKLIDVRTYLSLRDKYPFGSVRDPESGAIEPAVEYIPLDLLESNTSDLWSPKQVCDALIENGKFVILGDYGAGKSMTLRKLYQELRKRYFKNQTHQFPIFINLRDHFGQDNGSEILERHARLIGFPSPSHIVRAWRAGYAILLVDGIDEITTTGIQGLWKRIQDTRYRATQGVRELVRGHPHNVGIVLAGRAHFFDSEKERVRSLGLTADFHQLSLSEFTDKQIKKYLEKVGLIGNIPSWLPTRPLLVGYLASRKILDNVILEQQETNNAPDIIADPARGWDHLIDRVCDREADIEAGIDGPTVRKILERLATIARESQDGLGPLTPEQIIEGFKEICGYPPDEKGMVLLQRLPGLGIDRSDEQTRKFVDDSFADVCRSGDVCEFIMHPYDYDLSLFEKSDCTMNELGRSLTGDSVAAAGASGSKVNASLEHAYSKGASEVLKADLCLTFIQSGWAIKGQVVVAGAFVSDLVLDDDLPSMPGLAFRDCYFSRIYLAEEVSNENLPRFYSCYVGEIEGRRSRFDIPEGLFDEACIIDSFVGSERTTKAIISSDLPLGVRVLLTVIKKLYQQSGSGRKEKALISGLDHHARRLVQDVLKIAQSESLAIPYKRGGLSLWLPNRNFTARAARMLSAPSESDDPAVVKCKDIA
jgi:hypothetical protein